MDGEDHQLKFTINSTHEGNTYIKAVSVDDCTDTGKNILPYLEEQFVKQGCKS